MGAAAVGQLAAFLKRQREQTGCDLPHRHHLLVEHVSTGPGGAPGNQLVLHTLWGGRVNRPFVMALDAAWEHRYGQRLETYTGNDCIVIQLPHAVTGAEVLSLVSGGTVESLLRKRLEGSGFFGARFRECAGRALLLPRNRFGERMPLWMNRLRSQKLLEAVLRYEDFPILLEAWRACLQDEFDLENLRRLLAEMESGVIGWSETHTSYPSPMAQSLAWGQTNQYVYMGDEPAAGTASRLRGDLLSEAVFTPALRPSIAPDLVNRFQEKRQRLAPGYSPDGSRDLVDWVKERAAIPAGEWLRLLEAIQRDHALDTDEILGATADRLVRIRPPSSSESLVLALETAPRVMRALFGTTRVPLESMAEDRRPASSPPDGAVMDSDPDELLTAIVGEWLQYYGPVTTNFIASALGVDPRRLSLALEDLADSHRVITGQLTAGGDVDEVCDGENFEVLLRLARAQAVPVFEPLPAESLPLFVAAHQGLTNPGHEIDQLFRSVEQLLCLPLPAGAWEGEILPARLQPYYTSWLDSIMQEGDLRWVGRADRRVAFCFDADLDLLGPTQETDEGPGAGSVVGVLPELGRYDFTTLLRLTGRPAAQLSERLWQAVWRGQVTNDTFAALRKGIQNRFQVPTAATASQARERPARARSGFARWKGSLPSAGSWFRLPAPETPGDAIEAEERSKDRARLLLGRYGILFREILEKEAPQLRWGSVFRALRLMELSGEVLAGYFFHGIPGPPVRLAPGVPRHAAPAPGGRGLLAECHRPRLFLRQRPGGDHRRAAEAG